MSLEEAGLKQKGLVYVSKYTASVVDPAGTGLSCRKPCDDLCSDITLETRFPMPTFFIRASVNVFEAISLEARGVAVNEGVGLES